MWIGILATRRAESMGEAMKEASAEMRSIGLTIALGLDLTRAEIGREIGILDAEVDIAGDMVEEDDIREDIGEIMKKMRRMRKKEREGSCTRDGTPDKMKIELNGSEVGAGRENGKERVRMIIDTNHLFKRLRELSHA